MSAQIALPRDESVRGTTTLAVWAADSSRPIVVGQKYRRNPDTAYCWLGCQECVPLSGNRCWQRRTELGFVYRIRELHFMDYIHGLGRAFVVTLVKPDVWQMRAFTAGGSRLWEKTPQKWHTLTGLVWEAQIGESAE